MPLEVVVGESPLTLKIVESEEVRKNLSHPWRNSLYAVFLAEHIKKGDESKFKDYVQNLPKDLSNYPSFFGDTEKDYFQDSSYPIRKITERKAIEANDYLVIKKQFEDIEKDLSYDDFKAGKTLANLRAFEMTFVDGSMRHVLLPFVEFAAVNFGLETNVQLIQVDGRTRIRTTKEVKKGSMIVMLPNIANNTNLLINTGFTLEDNPNDCVDINIAISDLEAHFALKLELLETPGNLFNYQLRSDFSHPQSMEIFSFLRYVKFDEDEGYLLLTKNQAIDLKKKIFLQRGGTEDKWNPKGMFQGYEMNYCTRRCERNAIAQLGLLCKATLERFPTTLEQDLETLRKDKQEGNLSTNERNCIRIRVGEKQILAKWMMLTEKILPLLDDKITFQQAEELASQTDDIAFQQYFQNVITPLLKNNRFG